MMYCCVVSFPSMVSTQEQKANIIYILADDLGYGDVDIRARVIETPELDNLLTMECALLITIAETQFGASQLLC